MGDRQVCPGHVRSTLSVQRITLGGDGVAAAVADWVYGWIGAPTDPMCTVIYWVINYAC